MLLLIAFATCCGCSTTYLNLEVSVRDADTLEPIRDTVVVARYYAPLTRRQPRYVSGRTDDCGDVVLRLEEREWPLSISVSARGHQRHEVSIDMQDIMSSPQWHELRGRCGDELAVKVRVRDVADPQP